MIKKRIFIIWVEPLNPTGGGIHRCIFNLLYHLPQRGYKISYVYSQDNYESFNITDASGINRIGTLNIPQFKDHLVKNHCDVIIGQEAVFSDSFARFVSSLNLPDIKIIDQYHNTLLYFSKKLTWHYLKLEWILNRELRKRFGVLVRGITYPLWRYHVMNTQKKRYRYNYQNSNISLLLCEKEKKIMHKITNDTNMRKVVSIPNPLSWEQIADENILNNKKKEVLIVSRIYNTEKRIDKALQVWKILEHKGLSDGWKLRIVGEGIHKPYLMHLAERWRLKDVIWEDRQNPIPFYKNASIFLLTSVVEGWALTLTESMQMGVVPIAFDSYSAVSEIISDGYDGFLIPPINVNMMADRLYYLMHHDNHREEMAKNGLISCRRFMIEKVMDKWDEMLNKI